MGERNEIFGLPSDPALLKGLLATTAADHFFEGLKMELPHAVLMGRMAEWSRCAEAILRLLEADYARRMSEAHHA